MYIPDQLFHQHQHFLPILDDPRAFVLLPNNPHNPFQPQHNFLLPQKPLHKRLALTTLINLPLTFAILSLSSHFNSADPSSFLFFNAVTFLLTFLLVSTNTPLPANNLPQLLIPQLPTPPTQHNTAAPAA